MINESKKVNKAREFAIKAHEGQKRKGGAPYVSHPIAGAVLA